MICVDSDGNFIHPHMIKISELLNAHNLDINLPTQLLDIIVDKDSKLATVTIGNEMYIFKWQEKTIEHSIEYTIIINPSDSKKTIVELEDGDLIGYYSMDGSYYDSML